MTQGLERDRRAREARAEAETDEEPLPPLAEQVAQQIGGWRGLLEASIPVLVFVITNVIVGAFTDRTTSVAVLGDKLPVKIAVIASVGVALIMAAWRLSQRRSIRHAMNGLFGIALGAVLAWRSGDERDFYLPGLYIGMGYGLALAISVLVRQPLVGWIWSVVANGGRKDWQQDARLVRTFAWLTMLWAATYFVKTGVQVYLYAQHEATALGVARIVFGYPPYLLLLALTVWSVRRVRGTAEEPVA